MPKTIEALTLQELSPSLREMLAPAVERLGYFGEFFGYYGRSPDALIKFMEFTGACKKELPDDLNEVLALVVCSRLGGDYERIQHERLCESLGFDRNWISALIGRTSDDGVNFSSEQLACRALAEKIVEAGGANASTEIEAFCALVGPDACVAALWQISRFWMICILLNSFSMQPPRPSIFDE